MSNLFDDADDNQQEYIPAAEPQVQEQEQVAENPYAQEDQQQQVVEEVPQQMAEAPEEHKQDQYAEAQAQEEYKPAEVEQENVYAQAAQQQEMPEGFGAERANLMGEAAVQMPSYNTASVNAGDENNGAPAVMVSAGEGNLNERANAAKTQLMQAILGFNSERELVEGAAEESKDESEQNSLAFSVRDPVKVGKITKYTVTGRDAAGEFTCQRRFNEFEALYNILITRWPGCYIPAIPEKAGMPVDTKGVHTSSAGSDADFVEGRRILLEKFIRQLSQFGYLIESKECQIFFRGAGEVTTQLTGSAPELPKEILEKFRANFSIDEDQANSEMLSYKDKISVFQTFLTRAFQQTEKQVEAFRKYTLNYEQSHAHYKKIYTDLIAFEDMAIDAYSNGDRTKRALSHPIAQDIPTQCAENIEKWRNPFKDAWMTLRGEVLDLKAIMNAMNGRSKMEVNQTASEKKQRDKKAELEKMTLGKKTLKSFFKSKSTISKDIDAYSADIQQLDVDIEQFKKLNNFITIYHGQIAIDKFKKIKAAAYYKMLNNFSIKEVSNAHLHATLSHTILELQDQM